MGCFSLGEGGVSKNAESIYMHMSGADTALLEQTRAVSFSQAFLVSRDLLPVLD